MSAWTADEIEVLRENYRRGADWGSLLPGRTLKAVYAKAHEIGIAKRQRHRRWSDKAEELTFAYFKAMEARGFSPNACVYKYRELVTADGFR